MNITVDSFSKAKILVVGDVMLDQYWFGSVDRVSPEAPVPVLAVQNTEMRAGGAANVAHNLQSLGANSCLLSIVVLALQARIIGIPPGAKYQLPIE